MLLLPSSCVRDRGSIDVLGLVFWPGGWATKSDEESSHDKISVSTVM